LYPEKKKMVRLKESGLNNAEIGRIFNLTRERVRQLLEPVPRKPRKKKSINKTPFLTTSEVVQALGVHGNTVRRWCNNGSLKCYRVSSRGYRKFVWDDIVNFIKEK
jgi:excisionase family DNA binding protein